MMINIMEMQRVNRHADVAIRPTREPPDAMNAARICSLGFAIYASDQYLKSDPAAPHANSRWLVLNPGENKAPTTYWMQTHFADAFAAISADSYVALCRLAEQGHGLAVLPCCLGESSAQLVRVGEPLADIETALWVMTPVALAGVPRIRAFCEHVSAALAQDESVISGAPALA